MLWLQKPNVPSVHGMDASDPLIPPPDDSWFAVPNVGPDEDPDLALTEAVSDYFNFNAIAWPATNTAGALVPPPQEHVLDYLARSYDLVAEERTLVRPAASTVVVMSELPFCNLCGQPARYDGKLTVDGEKANAFACTRCYESHGSGTLGATGDAYLMTLDEVPPDVRAVCDELTAAVGRPSLWT